MAGIALGEGLVATGRQGGIVLAGEAVGHLLRPRLLDRLGRRRVAVIEAGGGFGKSVLAEQYRQSLGIGAAVVRLSPRESEPGLLTGTLFRSLRSARLSDLAAAMEGRDEPGDAVDRLLDALAASSGQILLVFDDAHHLHAGAWGLLSRLAAEVPDPHRLVVLSRAATPVPSGVRLGPSELAFSAAEIVAWFRLASGFECPDHAAAALAKATGGWPAALALAVARASASRDPLAEIYEIAHSPAHVGRLADDLLEILTPEDRRAVVQLAYLPLLSPRVANAVTGRPGLLARTAAAGLPMTQGLDGWVRFADPVAEHLRDLGPPEPATYRAASQAYLAAGEVLVAVATLLAGGHAEDAAAVLAGVAPERLERLGAAELRAVVGALRLPRSAPIPGRCSSRRACRS